MKSINRWAALPLLITLAACGDDRGRVDLPAGETAVAPATDPGPAPMPATAPGMGATIPLQPVGGSAFGGEVMIEDRGNQSEVMVRLTGTPGNTTHNGHIHSGRCDGIGGVVMPLQPITTDANGTGSMTTTVELAPMAVMDGRHIVVYHDAAGGPAACAEIPTHAM